MATSTTAATPPWCQHINNCTPTPPLSLGESFASKVGTRGNNSQKNHPSTVLREIPTRISPLPPTAAVVDRHDDDIERQPTESRPSLPTPLTVKTHVYGQLSAANVDDNNDARTLETKIEALMRRWPPSKIDGAPCHASGLATSHSTSPYQPVNPTDPVPDNYELRLDRLVAKVDQMRQRWPLSSEVAPTTATDPRPAHCNITGPATPATLPQSCTATGDDYDTSLLAAVQSLDNFLLKYPCPNDSDATYQPSTNRRQLPSCQERLAQQTQILCTMTVLLGELDNKLARFLDALSGSKKISHRHQPTFLPRNPYKPVLAAPRLPTKTTRTSQQSIPAKPPFPQFHHNLAMYRIKANLRPP